jgi:uncharacterized protein YndB with AHSA1/START domain
MPRIANRRDVTTETVTFTGEVSKFDDEKRLVFGWAYVTHDAEGVQVVDKSGEFVSDPEELEMASYKFMANSRVSEDWHGKTVTKDDGTGVGTVVESVFFSPEKCEAMGIPEGVMPTGWWIGVKVHKDDVWDAIKAKERSMFSVHGAARARPTS